MKATWALWAAAALAAATPAVRACGVCVEDKVAATYDYEVMQRAAATGKVMVFCEISGPVDSRHIRNAARRVRGLDVASVRISPEPAALSFALDAAQQSPQAAVLAMQRASSAGTRITILRLVAAPAAAAGTARR